MRIDLQGYGNYNVSIRDESGKRIYNKTKYLYTNFIEVPESWMPAIDQGYFLFVNNKKHGEFKSE